MADKFLNLTGLTYLWSKITNALSNKADVSDLPSQATEDTLGLIKLNPNQSVDVNSDGQLTVGGRLGQMQGGTGIFAPNDREPTRVADYSFLVTEAKGYAFNPSKSLGVLTGTGITCKSAAAGATEYRVSNNYANRILCKAVEGGIVALTEDQAKLGNVAKVLSVTINGQAYTPDSSDNSSTADIVITVDKTVNPSSATTSIRGYAIGGGGYSNLVVGQLANQGTAGASGIIGASVRNGANFSFLAGTQLYNGQSASALLGRQHINNKQNAFLAGQGHDSTNGSNNVAAVGAYSNITSTTAFAVGNGTNHTIRKNAFEVTTDGGIVLLSPNGTRYKITVDNSGNLTTTAV